MSDRLTLQSLAVHALPLWFLVFALFLPRIALVLAWFDHDLLRFHLDNIISPIMALLLPRVLILVLIYRDEGISMWFLIHLIVALCVWGGTGGRTYMRRGRRREDL